MYNTPSLSNAKLSTKLKCIAPCEVCGMWHLFKTTRPRGARRRKIFVRVCESNVSIHAPARGATCQCPRRYMTRNCFNPRARAGRDSHTPRPRDTLTVSIHAPARGATKHERIAATVIAFQSTRPRGARHPWALRDAVHYSVSIHAPARGATRGRQFI